jgi:hypothetical protein
VHDENPVRALSGFTDKVAEPEGFVVNEVAGERRGFGDRKP